MVAGPSREPNQWRRCIQWGLTTLYLILPFLKISNQPLLRMDLVEGALFLFGMVLRVEDLILFNLLLLGLMILLLWSSMALGRLWCGWLCPQSIFADLADWIEIRTGKQTPSAFLFHAVSIPITGVFALTTLFYFVSPSWLLRSEIILSFNAASVSLITVWAVLYLNMIYFRRGFCRYVCPYGKFLTIIADNDSMLLELPADRKAECIDCEACVDVCPVGVDIRLGAGGDCIMCGRCLEDCPVEWTGDPGQSLIRYRTGNRGLLKQLAGSKRIPILLASLLAIFGFFWKMYNPQELSFQVRVNAAIASQIRADGSASSLLTLRINNHSDTNHKVHLTMIAPSGVRISHGSPTLVVSAHTRVDHGLFIRIPDSRICQQIPLQFELHSSDGDYDLQKKLTLPPTDRAKCSD